MDNTTFIDEVIKLQSAHQLKEWVMRVKKQYQMEEVRALLQIHPIFNEIRREVCWGDSFMCDQMCWGYGGNYRFADYPNITSPQLDQKIMIGNIPHVIVNFALLTFDAQPEGAESESSDE